MSNTKKQQVRHRANGVSRRKFLKGAAVFAGATAAFTIVPSSVLGGNGSVPPSERINVGLIGRGIMGRGHWRVLLGREDAQAVALCDVDRTRCEEGRQIADETYGVAQRS